MIAPWPIVRLGDVLTRSQESITLEPDQRYREITVRMWGKGVVQRRALLGAEVAAQRRFVARLGQFILSRIDARNGALGIVPAALDGAIVTNDFPLFSVNQQRLLPAYLGWACKATSFVDQCRRASEGTTNRVRLQERKFLEQEVPLPPLAKQRRVAARIEELAGHIQEARDLRQQSNDLVDVLGRSILFHDRDAVPTPLNELVRLRPPDVTVRPDEVYQFAGVYSFGRGAFRGSKKSGADFSYPRLTRLKTGNFLYPKLMAWEGALSVVPHECDSCVVSTEFPVFEVLEGKVLPEVLDTYFKTPSVWPTLAGASTGTNVRRRRLNPKDFLAHKMPLPSKPTQKRLRHVAQELSSTRRLQSATAAEINALLPAILDRAFKGELL